MPFLSTARIRNHYAISPEEEWEDPVLAYVSRQFCYGFYEDDLIEAIDRKYHPEAFYKGKYIDYDLRTV